MSSSLRDANVRNLDGGTFDVLVIGGGINGAVSAACLSARGARVALVDRGDFASFTSQESSNLAWGGIKYMESLEFGLVRKLCRSRNHLIRSYPSTVEEIRFFAVHPKGFRHGLWKLVFGAWLYWFIGSFFTKRPRLLTREDIRREEPIVNRDGCDGGFEYSDAFLHDNDARFVWNFVRGALDHGCVAANYVEATAATREADGWRVAMRDVRSGRTFEVRARVLVNACGPFVDRLNAQARQETRFRHVFSKGIHLIVPRLGTNRRVLAFFADDGRPFFVVPMGKRTCIGTTDTRVEEPVAHVSDEDRAFVLDNINKRLALSKPLVKGDIVAERCGVRPLAVAVGEKHGPDWTQMSRKHAIESDLERKHVSIFGGKLTDCLNVGEEVARAVEVLGVVLPRPDAAWYGEPPEAEKHAFFEKARAAGLDALTHPESSEPLSARLWRRYGNHAIAVLDEIARDKAMADVVIEGTEAIGGEMKLAREREMIVTLDDFLRRRTKISLVLSRAELKGARGVRDACAILFGEDADDRYREYFA